MTNRVIHFEVQADYVERAKNFYEKVFNGKIQKMGSGDDPIDIDYWGLHTGEEGTPGINGGLYKRTPENKLYTFDCTIGVADIDKAVENIKKHGGTIRREKDEIPGVGWFVAAKDTEGNFFGILQPTERQPK